MIGLLSGTIVEKDQPGKLVVDVNGVGYDVETSLNTFFQIEDNKSIRLHIHTIVREDAFLLYGFLNKEERALFRALIKVNGVGPKLAMTILSSITPSEFICCIQKQDSVLLTKIPGIGKKTAERLLIEMRDTLKQFNQPYLDFMDKFSNKMHNQNEAISALEALGYKAQEASKAVHQIDDGTKSSEQLIRESLQILATL